MVCWVATVSRPGTRARLAQLASKVNPVLASNIYRINDLSKTAKESGARINRDLICRIDNLIRRLQQAADLKYLSGPAAIGLSCCDWVISFVLSPRLPGALAAFCTGHAFSEIYAQARVRP